MTISVLVGASMGEFGNIGSVDFVLLFTQPPCPCHVELDYLRYNRSGLGIRGQARKLRSWLIKYVLRIIKLHFGPVRQSQIKYFVLVQIK